LRHGAPLLGKRVLITGAAGGVGNLAVQLALRSSARVTAVVGSRERAHVLDGLGAAEIVTDIAEAQGRFDLILESAGGNSLTAAIQRIAARGTCRLRQFLGGAGAVQFPRFRRAPERARSGFPLFHLGAGGAFRPQSRLACRADCRRLPEAALERTQLA
jgi:NADPH:quinone reductase-like Zn-dependent oxidoreductase